MLSITPKYLESAALANLKSLLLGLSRHLQFSLLSSQTRQKARSVRRSNVLFVCSSDTTPPTLSFDIKNDQTAINGDLDVSINTYDDSNGDIIVHVGQYDVAVVTDPTSDEVVAGSGSGYLSKTQYTIPVGDYGVWQTYDLTGFAADTELKFYVVAVDPSGNKTSVITGKKILRTVETTSSGTLPTFSASTYWDDKAYSTNSTQQVYKIPKADFIGGTLGASSATDIYITTQPDGTTTYSETDPGFAQSNANDTTALRTNVIYFVADLASQWEAVVNQPSGPSGALITSSDVNSITATGGNGVLGGFFDGVMEFNNSFVTTQSPTTVTFQMYSAKTITRMTIYSMAEGIYAHSLPRDITILGGGVQIAAITNTHTGSGQYSYTSDWVYVADDPTNAQPKEIRKITIDIPTPASYIEYAVTLTGMGSQSNANIYEIEMETA